MRARPTPYQAILEPLERVAFPAVQDEAGRRGYDTARRDQFLLLGHVGSTLRSIVPDDAPSDALDQHAELLYHGFRFWVTGHHTYSLDDTVTAALTQPVVDLDDWELSGPQSCYIQFSYQRLWARVSQEAPFEPVDGMFVVTQRADPSPEERIHMRVLAILGFREDRPGVSLISYVTDLHPRAAAARARAPWRGDSPAFANAIPGGERKGYRALVTTSELEALALRGLAHVTAGTGDEGRGTTREEE